MWNRLNGLVKESRVVTLVDTASAIRVLFEKHRVVAEGAAGTALAAASLEDDRSPTRVAVISGGNIDPAKLMTILSGSVPRLIEPLNSSHPIRAPQRSPLAS